MYCFAAQHHSMRYRWRQKREGQRKGARNEKDKKLQFTNRCKIFCNNFYINFFIFSSVCIVIGNVIYAAAVLILFNNFCLHLAPSFNHFLLHFVSFCFVPYIPIIHIMVIVSFYLCSLFDIHFFLFYLSCSLFSIISQSISLAHLLSTNNLLACCTRHLAPQKSIAYIYN